MTYFFQWFFVLMAFFPSLALAQSSRVVEKIDSQHTLTVLIDGFHRQQVRLYGIDLPDEGQPFGVAATRRLKRLTAQPFQIETVRQDEQGRSVALLVSTKGQILNAQPVAEGYAWVDGKQCRHGYCSEWMTAQSTAKEQRIGLWSQPSPQPPWQWRKNH